MWAVLGVDQGLFGRSWGRIRAYVGGLGRGSGPIVVQTRAGGRSWNGIRPESGPNLNGRSIQKGRAPIRGIGPHRRHRRHRPHKPPEANFSVCVYI